MPPPQNTLANRPKTSRKYKHKKDSKSDNTFSALVFHQNLHGNNFGLENAVLLEDEVNSLRWIYIESAAIYEFPVVNIWPCFLCPHAWEQTSSSWFLHRIAGTPPHTESFLYCHPRFLSHNPTSQEVPPMMNGEWLTSFERSVNKIWIQIWLM